MLKLKKVAALSLFIFVVLFVTYGHFEATSANGEIHNRIRAKVTDKIITQYDLTTRIKNAAILSNINLNALNASEKANLENQALESLIDDKIAELEAKRLGIEVNDEMLKDFFEDLAKANNTSVKNFITQLISSGINMNNFKQQIKAKIIWSVFVKMYLKNKAHVNSIEVIASQNIAERLKAERTNNANKSIMPNINDEIEIAEIVLPADYNENGMNVNDLLEHIGVELRNGTPFAYLAAQYSINDLTSSNGGLVPKLKLKNMDQTYIDAITRMQKGDVADPIQVDDKIIVIKLVDFKSAENVELKKKANVAITDEDIKNAIIETKLETHLTNHLAKMKKQYFIQILN